MRTSTDTASQCRAGVATMIVAVAVFLGILAAGPAGAAVVLDSNQVAVKNTLNTDRHANNLRPLVTQSDAQAKAQAWAEHLASEGHLSHSVLTDGIHAHWCSLGENVGFGPTVASIENAYMHSPKHRANILDSRFNGVGVGYAVRGNSIYTVQVFIKTC